jgi:hypothetical protein
MEHLLNTVLDALPQIFGDLVPVCVSDIKINKPIRI